MSVLHRELPGLVAGIRVLVVLPQGYLTALSFGGPSCILPLILILPVTILLRCIVLNFDKVLLVHVCLVLNFSCGPFHPIYAHSFEMPARGIPIRTLVFICILGSAAYSLLTHGDE